MSHTHTSFSKGAKIRIILWDGTVIIGKFIEKINHHSIRIECAGARWNILQSELKSCNYYKPLPHEMPK